MNNRYMIRREKEENFIAYPSPSIILGQLSKGEALLQWAVNEAIDYIERELEDVDLNNVILDQWFKLVNNDARHAWKNRRDHTANLGSELHKAVETYINIKLRLKDPKSFVEHVNRLRIKDMFNRFLEWEAETVKEFLESEQPVRDHVNCYAGTLDFIYLSQDDLIDCADLKTSKSIYKEHEIQVAAYKYARQMMLGKYNVQFNQGLQSWQKTFEYNKIMIDRCSVLRISQHDNSLQHKIVQDQERKYKSFLTLVDYYYISANRKMNNHRAAA